MRGILGGTIVPLPDVDLNTRHLQGCCVMGYFEIEGDVSSGIKMSQDHTVSGNVFL